MESPQSVFKLSTESVGSRRELVANSCTHRRRDATNTVHCQEKSHLRVCCVAKTRPSSYHVIHTIMHKKRLFNNIRVESPEISYVKFLEIYSSLSGNFAQKLLNGHFRGFKK